MRKWRVGTFSMALLMIGVGVLMLLGQFEGLSTLELITTWWPLVLIALGIEVLAYVYFSREETPKIKFDGLSILIIILIIFFTAGAYGVKTVFNFIPNSGIQNIFGSYKYESKFTKNITVDPGNAKKLSISNRLGKVEVNKATGTNIEIKADIAVRNNDEEYAKTFSDSAVEITKGQEIEIASRGYNSDNKIQGVQIDYAISVPQGIEVSVDNKFGDVRVSQVSAPVDISNSNGKTYASDIGGNLNIKNSFGSIEVNNVNGDADIRNSNGLTTVKTISGSVSVNNSFGDIEVQNINGSVRAQNSNGKIYAENTLGDLYAHTSFGSIDIRNAYREIDLGSSNGSINFKTDKPIEKSLTIKDSFGGINITVPNSQSAHIKASTSFGSIKSNLGLNINKNNSKESVDQQLGSESIYFNISTSNGSIEINGN